MINTISTGLFGASFGAEYNNEDITKAITHPASVVRSLRARTMNDYSDNDNDNDYDNDNEMVCEIDRRQEVRREVKKIAEYAAGSSSFLSRLGVMRKTLEGTLGIEAEEKLEKEEEKSDGEEKKLEKKLEEEVEEEEEKEEEKEKVICEQEMNMSLNEKSKAATSKVIPKSTPEALSTPKNDASPKIASTPKPRPKPKVQKKKKKKLRLNKAQREIMKIFNKPNVRSEEIKKELEKKREEAMAKEEKKKEEEAKKTTFKFSMVAGSSVRALKKPPVSETPEEKRHKRHLKMWKKTPERVLDEVFVIHSVKEENAPVEENKEKISRPPTPKEALGERVAPKQKSAVFVPTAFTAYAARRKTTQVKKVFTIDKQKAANTTIGLSSPFAMAVAEAENVMRLSEKIEIHLKKAEENYCPPLTFEKRVKMKRFDPTAHVKKKSGGKAANKSIAEVAFLKKKRAEKETEREEEKEKEKEKEKETKREEGKEKETVASKSFEKETTVNQIQRLLLNTKSKMDILNDGRSLRSVKKSKQLIVKEPQKRNSFIATG